jgi:hypothetical protein
LYSAPNTVGMMISRMMALVGHVGDMEKMRNYYKIEVGEPEGKRPLGRSRRKWEDSIKMDFR